MKPGVKQDGASSTAALADSTGNLEWTYSYEPFGAGRTTTQIDPNAPDNPTQYTGQYLDPQTGLYNLRARQYDPTTGRFLTIDPLTPALSDPYVSDYIYANDRPTTLTDPSGLCPFDPSGCKILTTIAGLYADAGKNLANALLPIEENQRCEAAVNAGEIRGATRQCIKAALFDAFFVIPLGRGARAAEEVAPLIKAGAAGGQTAGKRFPRAVRDAALKENPDICVFCRMKTKTPQVDHAIARVRNGDATLENAQTTCPWCNPSKGSRDYPVNPPPEYEGPWPPPWWRR